MVSALYMNNFNAENIIIISQMFYLAAIDLLEINNFNCLNCYSPSTFQQIFYLQFSTSPYALDNKTIVFRLDSFFCNYCRQGLTTIIYIDSDGETPLSLFMSNIVINNSLCGDGMIYLSEAVNLQSGLLENISVSNSFSSGAIIRDSHSTGKLKILNFLSFFNIANYAGVSSSYDGLYND